MIRILLAAITLFAVGCQSISASTVTATIPSTPPAPTDTAIPTNTTTPVPDGPCDNPLVPLATGNEWLYRVENQKGASIYSLKTLDRQDTGNIAILVEFIDQRHNTSFREPVVCQAGVIENFPLFVTSMLFSGFLGRVFDTYHESGIYSPAYSDLVENNWSMAWQAEYLTEDDAYLENPMGGSDLMILQSTPIDLSFQTNGHHESVTTPAGKYTQSLKVFHDFSLLVSLTIPGGATSGKLTIKTTQWYEPYTGLLRAQIDSASLETMGNNISVPFQSTVELEAFTPGK